MNLTGQRWRASTTVGAGLIGLAMVLLLSGRLDEIPIGAMTDDAYYIEMARSIAAGRGPEILIGPDSVEVGPATFPPGFSYLLSPIAKLQPNSLTALRLVPLLAALLLLPLALATPGRNAAPGLRLALGAIVALNPWLISWAGRVLSDLPYAALALSALILFLTWRQVSHYKSIYYIVTVIVLTAAVSVRTIGWSAVLAVTVTLALERRWRAALGFLLPTAALVALLQSLTLHSGLVTPGYATQMLEHGGVSAWRFGLDNLLHYLARLPVLMVPVFGQPVLGVLRRVGAEVLYPATAFSVGTALVVVAGVAVKRRWTGGEDSRRVRLFTLYLLFYLGALSQFDGYPSGVQTRLLLPLLPILVWLFLLGIGDLSGPRRRLPGRLVVGVLLVAALTHNGWRLAHPLRTSIASDGRGLVDPAPGTDWIRHNAVGTRPIMVQDTIQRHIHWRRPVVAFPDTSAIEAIERRCRRYAVSHVFVGPTVHHRPRQLDAAGRSMLTALRARPDLFREVHAEPREAISIFAFLPVLTTAPGSTQP